MALFQVQDTEGCAFTLRPNCALSWRATKYLVLFFACCLGLAGAYFASLGAWLVLPFAGLEMAVLGAGFYVSALAGHTREVIEIRGAVVSVLRGRRRLVEVARLPRHWTQVSLVRDPRGWYPSRLLLRGQGRQLEVAAKVVEAEREELAAELQGWLGFASPAGGGMPAGESAPARFDEGAPVLADARVPPRGASGDARGKRVLRKI
jgi:uncharacterized membrane protein